MKISNKILWILSGILGTIFLIIVISLAIMDKIKTTALIIFIVIIVLAVFVVDMSFYLVRKKKKISVETGSKKIKAIDLLTAQNLAKELLMSEQFSEYEKECKYEDIWHMGDSKTPIYAKLVVGEFDGNLLGILVNMEISEKRGIKEYKEYEITRDKILEDMERRANFLAVSPRPVPAHEEEIIEKPSGERVVRRRVLAAKEAEEKESGGLK